MDVMVDELTLCLVSNGMDSKIMIAPVDFATFLVQAAQFQTAYNEDDANYLSIHEKKVKTSNLEKIYFPAHVHDGHWIACLIDFEWQIVAYARLMRAIKRWLKHLNVGWFMYQGDSLDHELQMDGNSCGVASMNIIAHDVFEDHLWTQNRNVHKRLQLFNWLLVFMKSEYYDGAETPPPDHTDEHIHPTPPTSTKGMDEFEGGKEESEEAVITADMIVDVHLHSMEQSPETTVTIAECMMEDILGDDKSDRIWMFDEVNVEEGGDVEELSCPEPFDNQHGDSNTTKPPDMSLPPKKQKIFDFFKPVTALAKK
ncbi:hypothetical protein BDQ17DRAFT_1429172 [Cyathus striatus]|nr:hypothetical protein BDQ17DRAFT_1429172 [Cyathus striatus]